MSDTYIYNLFDKIYSYAKKSFELNIEKLKKENNNIEYDPWGDGFGWMCNDLIIVTSVLLVFFPETKKYHDELCEVSDLSSLKKKFIELDKSFVELLCDLYFVINSSADTNIIDLYMAPDSENKKDKLEKYLYDTYKYSPYFQIPKDTRQSVKRSRSPI